jgi:hypothetical protein
MTRSFRQVSVYGIGRALGVSMAAITLSVAFAAEARAGCFPNGFGKSSNGLQAGSDQATLGKVFGEPSTAGPFHSIVGLWRVAFLVGDGPTVAYEGFQQWHGGGTEVMVDNGFDLEGNRIPELHAEGRLRASRITVD